MLHLSNFLGRNARLEPPVRATPTRRGQADKPAQVAITGPPTEGALTGAISIRTPEVAAPALEAARRQTRLCSAERTFHPLTLATSKQQSPYPSQWRERDFRV